MTATATRERGESAASLAPRSAAVLLLVVGSVMLGGGTASARTTSTVSATDDVFTPRTIKVDPGETVAWSNDGETVHTVTADDASFDSGLVAAGDTFSFTFRDEGTYAYHCAVHGAAGGLGMAATVIVGNPASDAPTEEGSNEQPAAPAATATPAPSEMLPATGTSPYDWLVLGLAQILSGAGLLAAIRRF